MKNILMLIERTINIVIKLLLGEYLAIKIFSLLIFILAGILFIKMRPDLNYGFIVLVIFSIIYLSYSILKNFKK